jgi:DNA-binding NarL/FixJ family response regulator
MAENMAQALTRPFGDDCVLQDALSDRELEVYRRIVAGEALSEIALALTVSPKTVSTYKARVLDKMQVSNDAALIRYAIKHRLFDEPEA